MSDGRCRILGIQLGEAALNLILPGEVPIKAKFALLDEDGSPCGSFVKHNGWSESTLEALRALANAIEADAIGHVFEGDAVEGSSEKTDGPPQF